VYFVHSRHILLTVLHRTPHIFLEILGVEPNTLKMVSSDVLEVLNEINFESRTTIKQYLIYKCINFDDDLMFSSSFSPIFRNRLDLYSMKQKILLMIMPVLTTTFFPT